MRWKRWLFPGSITVKVTVPDRYNGCVRLRNIHERNKLPMPTCKFLILLGLLTNLAIADDFPPVVNSPSEAHLKPMDAAEVLKTLKLPAGFQASLFASEPDVQNPIAMAFDPRGRLWVAENYTYSDRSQRFDLAMRDRVVIFEDADGDGCAEKRSVFTDQVQMLTSIELGLGGAWLMCPPKLLFIPDAELDGTPDGPAQVILDGFDVAQDNYHNFANGLKFGPDGWLYGRCGHSCPGMLGRPGTPADQRVPIDGGIWRYHPTRQLVEVLCHGTVNPWGHDWDRHGELFFVNTVIGHLWHMLPGAHFKESFGESMNPYVYQRLDMIADHYHFDAKGNWSESRDGKANDLGGGHAHIGATIVKSSRWPAEYQDKLLTINMHGRRVNTEILERHGAGYVGKHAPDLAVFSDPFFRGIDLRFGPDGQLFVIDWSDTGECHESTGVHRTSGRIYKISYTGALKDHSPSTPVGFRLPTQASVPELLGLLESSDEHVRVGAIRRLTDSWPIDSVLGPHPQAVSSVDAGVLKLLVHRAQVDQSGLVQLTLASVLQRLPVDQRGLLAIELVKKAELAEDRDFPLMVWFGLIPLGKQNPQALVPLSKENRLPLVQRYIVRMLASMSSTKPQPLDDLLSNFSHIPTSLQGESLTGLSQAYQGLRKATAPQSWSSVSSSKAAVEFPDLVRKLNVLYGDGVAIAELRTIVMNAKVEMQIRQQALASLIDARPDDLQKTCESLLDTRILNATALRGLGLVDDPAIARTVAQKFKRFQAEDRPTVIEWLVSRPSSTAELLDVMGQKNSPIAPADLSVFQARRILAMNNTELSEKLGRVWGRLREGTSQRRELIVKLKSQLTETEIKQADLSAGRRLFQKSCSQCHQLYDQGKRVGPDLTGSQRGNLDYLLENIVDPSAVVGKDYRMTILLTSDGRSLSGLIVSKNDKVLVLQTQTAQETLPIDEVDETRETSLSPMPEGLMDKFSAAEIRDLIGYLMHPTQVGL